jgi:hypothetical protein
LNVLDSEIVEEEGEDTLRDVSAGGSSIVWCTYRIGFDCDDVSKLQRRDYWSHGLVFHPPLILSLINPGKRRFGIMEKTVS